MKSVHFRLNEGYVTTDFFFIKIKFNTNSLKLSYDLFRSLNIQRTFSEENEYKRDKTNDAKINLNN